MATDQIQVLAKSARNLRFGKGEKIISQDDPGQSMYVLSSGVARVTAQRDGRESILGELVSGECFGEISLLTGSPRTATVIAKTDCDIVEIDHTAMRDLLPHDPPLAGQLSVTPTTRRPRPYPELAPSSTDHDAAPLLQSPDCFLARPTQSS